MVVNARLLKKRRLSTELYDFFSFPSPGSDLIALGPFRSNVKAFLARHAVLSPPTSILPHLVTWKVLFHVRDLIESPAVVYLDVVEEDVARSKSVYCDQCRVVGWGGHPVCSKRYHFIVKAVVVGNVKPCPNCGVEVNLTEPRCKKCKHAMTFDDIEECTYHHLEDTTHLLHGVIHANGYGHLLRVNGREGGSRVLLGSHIMDFWDRLCKYLGVRKVSVMDVSKKYGLDYRLLYAITKGHSWYGDWGYEFGYGSFALTHDTYKESVETLSNLPLSVFIFQGRKPRTCIQELILYYQSHSESELVNIRDLFQFLMSLVHDGQKSSITFKKRRWCGSGVLCAWTSDDIKRVEDAMIKVLRAVTSPDWVSWRTLRGAVCKVAPPELLDYCLKELAGKKATDGMTVHARCNPDFGALEYRLGSGFSSQEGNLSSGSPFPIYPSRDHVLRDLKFLYDTLLHPRTMLILGPEPKRDRVLQAASRLLDCKQFVKDYKPETLFVSNNFTMFFLCQPKLLDPREGRPPPELVVLPANATISDLKLEASKAFQEVYIMFQGFQAEELVDYRGVEDSALVKHLVNPLRVVGIRGRYPVKSGMTRFRMERGTEKWTVDCSCGARDDDGERMIACDVCSIWQHTRCVGILDFEAVPGRFVCSRCIITGRTALAKISGLNCKDESAVLSSSNPKALAMLYGVR